MEFKTLLFDVQDNVAHVSLNRPQAANTINLEMAKELMQIMMECDENTEIRAVLLGGEGDMFCGGGDLGEIGDQGDNASHHLKKITSYLHVAISYMMRMDPPVVAAVHGSAAGAGLGLVCASDIIFTAEDSNFTMAYTGVGLTPDAGSTYTLPRIVGAKRTLELAMTNRRLTAQEALDWGIVSRVVQKDDLIQASRAMATQLSAGPTKAFGTTKRLVVNGFTESLEGQLNNESRSIADMAKTLDGQEGIDAFLKKRSPNFNGQ